MYCKLLAQEEQINPEEYKILGKVVLAGQFILLHRFF